MRFTKILLALIMPIATILVVMLSPISAGLYNYFASSLKALSKEIVQIYDQRTKERVYAFARNADLFYRAALSNEPTMGPDFGFRNHQFAVSKHKEFFEKHGSELRDLRAKLKSCGAQTDKLDERLRDNRPDLMFISFLAQTLIDTVGSIPNGRPECGTGEEPGHFREVSGYYVLNTEGNSYGWSEYDLRKRPSMVTVGG